MISPASTRGSADLLAIAFGTTVAMWSVAYICRLPPTVVSGKFICLFMLACLFLGGFAVVRYGSRGWKGGLQVGVLTAFLNMLILGSLLAGDQPNRIVPSALLWVPGTFLASAVVGAAGAALGRVVCRTVRAEPKWKFVLTAIPTVAALLLLTAGGLVTSKEAGLAVVDWPNSFGYNMFFYPLSRMTGGIFYEHAHRLLGTLVGLSVIVLTVQLWRVDHRAWIRWLSVFLLVMIVCQGILGGLRVTGHFTLATSREAVAPSITLAIIHGVLGQLVLATLASLCVLNSTAWLNSPAPRPSPSVATDRTLTASLMGLLLLQLVLGALLRHTYRALHIHITIAVLVAVLAAACGLRAAILYRERIIRLNGLVLLALTGLQVLLGILALVSTGATAFVKPPPIPEVTFATAHQIVGAILLCCAMSLVLWHRRLCSTPGAG